MQQRYIIAQLYEQDTGLTHDRHRAQTYYIKLIFFPTGHLHANI